MGTWKNKTFTIYEELSENEEIIIMMRNSYDIYIWEEKNNLI